MKTTIQVTKKVLEHKYTCDKCNQDIINDNYSGFSCDISLRDGEIDPYEGFIGDEYEVHLCEPCALHLFNVIFKENGIKVNQ